jgi:hypothetical protein
MIERLATLPTYEVYKNVGRNKRSVSGKGSHRQKRLSAYSGLRIAATERGKL